MRIRWNVIYLISLGYGAVGVVFAVLMARDMPPADAYDIVQGPLMALIGGTVALAEGPGSVGQGGVVITRRNGEAVSHRRNAKDMEPTIMIPGRL